MNKISHTRRCQILSAVPGGNSFKECEDKVKTQEKDFEGETTRLFGKKFADRLSVDTKQLKQVCQSLQMSADLKNISKGKTPSPALVSTLKCPFWGGSGKANSSPGAMGNNKEGNTNRGRGRGYLSFAKGVLYLH